MATKKTTRRVGRMPVADRLTAKAQRLARIMVELDGFATDSDLKQYSKELESASDSLFSPAAGLALAGLQYKAA